MQPRRTYTRHGPPLDTALRCQVPDRLPPVTCLIGYCPNPPTRRANRPNVLAECLAISSLISTSTVWVQAQAEVLKTVLLQGGITRW